MIVIIILAPSGWGGKVGWETRTFEIGICK